MYNTAMALPIILLTVGLFLVVKGADLLVDGASKIARRFHISELIIGLTIVAFGTSAPELAVNIFSSVKGENDIILENIIGSNIFNLALILGIAGLIFPLKVQRTTVIKELPFALGTTILFFLLVNDPWSAATAQPRLSRLDALVLLVLFALFLGYLTRQALENRKDPETAATSPIWQSILFISLGFAGLFLGGKLVVHNAVAISKIIGLSEKIIGATIVAAGTSFPELATSVVAAYKHHDDIAVGNVVGSNIFNLLFIMGVSGLIRPVGYSPAFNTDLSFLLVASLFFLTAMFTGEKGKLDRWEAAILLTLFPLYIIFILR